MDLLKHIRITRVVGDVIVIGQAPRLDPDEHFESENEGEEAVMNASNEIFAP